ncbi:MAG TPA: PAS domain S-box protein [Thermoanaerobaculia bacterium]|nr:PAS domain S-box protein [Thermoanaerobaculia bacterium]
MLSKLLFRLRRIELQLPLSIAMLLLGAVLVFAASAYNEVRRDAVETTTQRLAVVSGEVTELFERSFALRLGETQAIADHPAVRALLEGQAEAEARGEAVAVLEAVRASSPLVLGVQLWDAEGRLLLEARKPGGDDEQVWQGGSQAPQASTVPGLGDLHERDGLVWYDLVGVAGEGGSIAGRVVQSRQISSQTGLGGMLPDLVGMQAAFVLGRPGKLWTDMTRIVSEPPLVAVGMLGAREYASADRGRRFGFGQPIGDTGWQLWVEAPRATVLRGPRRFLARIVAIGVAVALLGVVVGWRMSRGVTERLERLRVSANAISGGNYERPALVEGEDELGELAAAFNTMAAHVAESHHRLEHLVDDRTAELRASEERYRTLATTANASIVTGDARGEITYVNPAAEALFGWSVEEAIGQPLAILVPERLREAHTRGLERVLAGEEPRMIGRTSELMALHRDGSELPIELSLASWRQYDGDLSFCAIIQDISARKEDEAALHRYAAELEIANRELEAFTHSASHDLRAPLRAIQAFGGFLLEDSGHLLDERGLEHARRMCAAAGRMRELIDGLLALARASRQELVPETVDLTALAHQVTDELRAATPEREVEVRIAEGLVAHGDSNLLGLLLHNLLGNAWKFTSKTERAEIELAALATGETTYYLKDNGAGFDMQFADQLFQPFRRLHAESEFPGTGMGLSLVHRIVERHRGRVWAESTPGNGATFYFELPRDLGA